MVNATPGRRPDWVSDELFPFESRFVDVDGHVVHYVDEGEGPTLLLYHGNPTWSFLYRGVIEGLRDRFRCVAFDYPGFGLSAPAPGYGFTAAEHTDVAESLVETLDVGEITAMVHDWGGPIGLTVAARHRERYRAVIVANTWAWPMRRVAARLFSGVVGGPVGRSVVRRGHWFARTALRVGHRRRMLTDQEMRHYRDPFPDGASRLPTAVLPREITHATALLRETEAGLRTMSHLPALILWGDRDPVFGRHERCRWRTAFPSHRERVIGGAGHHLPDDAAGDVVDAIDAWWPPP